MGAADGSRAAVGDELATLGEAIAERRDAGAGEQLDLIGIPARFSDDRTAEVRLIAARGRRGRPAGAPNKATAEVKEFCRRVFAYDPMVEGFRWLQHTPETFAEVMGCSKLEAFDRLERLRSEMMPYFYARVQPVDVDGRPVPVFNMQFGGNHVHVEGSAPWVYAGGPQVEQKQGVSASAPAVSHGDASHEEPK